MTDTPLVNTIICTRGNRPELLAETLEKIAAQDYEGTVMTTVVFDQCEPDESVVVEGGNRPVQAITNVRKPGLQGSRNTGIESVDCEIVAFCDDDDTWYPSKIRRQIDLANANPEVLFFGCGVTVAYEDHRVDRIRDDSRVTFRDLLESRVFELHPSTFLFRRAEILDRVGLVDEDVPYAYPEDYEFLLRTAKASDILLVPSALTTVRWHDSWFAERWQMRIEGMQYILDKYPEFETEPVGFARILGQQAFAKAALGERGDAIALCKRILSLNPTEPRVALAGLAMVGVPPGKIVGFLQRRGKSV